MKRINFHIILSKPPETKPRLFQKSAHSWQNCNQERKWNYAIHRRLLDQLCIGVVKKLAGKIIEESLLR